MFRNMPFSYKSSIFLSSLIAAVSTFLFVLKNTGNQGLYSDFIVGSLAWGAQTKSQDLNAIPLSILAFVCASMALYWFIEKLGSCRERSYVDEFVNQLLLWSIPAVAAFGGTLLGADFDKHMLALSAIGLAFVTTALAISLRANKELRPSFTGLYFAGALMLSIIPFEIVLIVGRFSKLEYLSALNNDVLVAQKFCYAIFCIAVTFFLFTISFAKRFFDSIFTKLLVMTQIFMTSFFVTLYPAKLESANGALFSYQTSPLLVAILLLLIVWGCIDIIKRYNQYERQKDISIFYLISPVAIFALLVDIKFGVTIFPRVSPDDYHYGEHLLGFWSYLHGAIPYVDYIPPHGIVDDDLTSFFSKIFFDGSGGALDEAGRLTYAFLSIFAFWAIYRYTNNILLAFICILLIGGRLTWVFLIPFFYLWFLSSLRYKPIKWIQCWMLTVPVVVFGTPAQGILLVVSSLPMFLLMIKNAWVDSGRSWRFFQSHSFISVALVFICMAIFTPLIPMSWGIINYILENASINQPAYGIAWSLSWGATNNSGLVFELIRMAWVVAPIISIYLVVSQIVEHRRITDIVAVALSVIIFSLLLMPYTMGRIDPGAFSRPGIATIFMWCAMIPLVCWSTTTDHKKALLLLCISFFGSALTLSSATFPSLSSSYKSFSFSGIAATVAPKNSSPILFDGKSVGLDNLGLTAIDPTHLQRLVKLKKIISQYVTGDDIYLDLTSRNAQYFYLGLLPPIPVSAPYNMVPIEQQKHAVELLSKKLPSLVLLEGNNITHDGGGLALRNPVIFRFVLDNYVPFYEDGFILAVPKNSQLAEEKMAKISLPIKDLTDSNWIHGISRAGNGVIIDNILGFPLTLGKNIEFPNSIKRSIVGIHPDGNAIFLDGPPFDDSLRAGVSQSVLTDKEDGSWASKIENSLFDKSMSNTNLSGIPSAWGASYDHLASKMVAVETLKNVMSYSDVSTTDNSTFLIKGADPQIIYRIEQKNISGRQAGLLKFEFTCIEEKSTPAMQVFWWGDDDSGPTEASSVQFSGRNGVLIVPLDVSARWINLNLIRGIRIDLNNPGACKAIKIGSLSLYQRRF